MIKSTSIGQSDRSDSYLLTLQQENYERALRYTDRTVIAALDTLRELVSICPDPSVAWRIDAAADALESAWSKVE